MSDYKNISKTKLSLALISLVITFFVWQQGLRDSLNRPSVSFDISQKEQEILELSAVWGCGILLDEADIFLEKRSKKETIY